MAGTVKQSARSERDFRVHARRELLRDAAERCPQDLSPELFAAFVAAVEPALSREMLADGSSALDRLASIAVFACRREPEEIRVRYRPLPGGRVFFETCMPDGAFIFGTVLMVLAHEGLSVVRHFHAIAPLQRDDDGTLQGVGTPDSLPESIIHVEVEGLRSEGHAADLAGRLHDRLRLVHAVVSDFEPMVALLRQATDRMASVADNRPDSRGPLMESVGLLRWLLDENFVFMGARYVAGGTDAEPPELLAERNLGMWGSQELGSVQPPDSVEETVAAAGLAAPYVWVHRSREEAPIHRTGKLVHLLVRWFDASERAGGVVMFTGLFTYKGINSQPATVPVLEGTLDRLVRDRPVVIGSYRHRAMRNAFNALPVEYLFMADDADVGGLVDRILDVDAEQSTDVFIVNDEEQGFAILFVALPRQHFTEDLRRLVQERLGDRFGASYIDSGVYLGARDTAIIYFYLTGPSGMVLPDTEELRQAILRDARPWEDQFLEALADRDDGRELFVRYRTAFPGHYLRSTPMDRILADIDALEGLGRKQELAVALLRDEQDHRLRTAQLRLYSREAPELSTVLPRLHNFGLVVADQEAIELAVTGGRHRHMDTYRITGYEAGNVPLWRHRESLLVAIANVLQGRGEDGPLNRLVLAAGIEGAEVDLLRAYIGYARQLGVALSSERIRVLLTDNAAFVRALMGVIRWKFDPDLDADARPERLKEARAAAVALLDAIDDAGAYRVLKLLLELVDASVRISYYVRRDPDAAVALKLDASLIEAIPKPRPFREIYVYHRRFVGVHLRGGPVARGGLRWSDRVEDFRSEVFGLMRTQMVKNVLIVPSGAKGGFALRNPPADAGVRRDAADRSYRRFVEALLDVTDNVVDGRVVPPDRVVRYDDDDPYLVVAADKGTAHLSDTANGIAERRGFWLGDAFASGGSRGYDHKKTGITARGAWVAVRRHFDELGLDPESDPIRVVGIGDMSGDVFGNGMLRSRSMKLVAAFDHRHLFIDPDPGPASSYAERERLFGVGRSSWADYATAALSQGAVVAPRNAKSVTLSPEAREALGVEAEQLSGDDVVKAILQAPVDLLWNGGIGTYVKASAESQADADDRTNDDVRVDAESLRVRVVGEGGNLGFTQQARIAFAAGGGRINTDAIDNSGGVNLSDREVNLKLGLAEAMRRVGLTTEQRNVLLTSVETEMCERVLEDNRVATRLLSMDEARSRADPLRFDRATRFVLDELQWSGLTREALALPTSSTLRSRAIDGVGLHRPELAVLSAYGKMLVYRRLVSEGLLDAEMLRPFRRAYFPAEVVERYGDVAEHHPLGKEIALMVVSNHIVNYAGTAFFPEAVVATGAKFSRVAAAYLAAERFARAHWIRDAVAALDRRGVPADVRYRLLMIQERALDAAVTWILAEPRRLVQIGMTDPPPDSLARVVELTERLRGDDSTAAGAATAQRARELRQEQVPGDLASRVAVLERFTDLLQVSELSLRNGRKPEELAARYFELGMRTGLFGVLNQASQVAAGGSYVHAALRVLRQELRAELATLVEREPPASAIREFQQEIERFASSEATVEALYLLERRLRRGLARATTEP